MKNFTLHVTGFEKNIGNENLKLAETWHFFEMLP